jgi:hypothetical protein
VKSRRAKAQKKNISNNTINKLFVPLKMLCKHVAIERGWAGDLQPVLRLQKAARNRSLGKDTPFLVRGTEAGERGASGSLETVL